jgi:hypothetical protein
VFVLLMAASVAAAQSAGSKPPKAAKRPAAAVEAALPTAISGTASSGRNCVASTNTASHHLGWAPRGSRVTVTFSSDFDPIAALNLVQLGEAASDRESDLAEFVDDDSGGNLDPRISTTTPFAGTLMLYVSAFSQSQSGCYYYKAEIQTP